MKAKIINALGYGGFIIYLILISPVLFITGGVVRIIRFYKFVRERVHERKPPTYYW